MRTYSYILLTVLLSICYGTRALAQEPTTEILIGTWTLDYDVTFAKMEKHMKTAMDSLPQSHRTSIENNYRGRTMVFGSGGDLKLLFFTGREIGGSWALEQNGNSLVLTDPNGHKYPHKIKDLTSIGMVLNMEDSGDTKLFVKELYFIKN